SITTGRRCSPITARASSRSSRRRRPAIPLWRSRFCARGSSWPCATDRCASCPTTSARKRGHWLFAPTTVCRCPATGKRRGAVMQFRRIEVIALGVVFLLAGGVALPAVHQARQKSDRETAVNNVKQLGIACHAVHDTYKCFPPIAGKLGGKQGSLF